MSNKKIIVSILAIVLSAGVLFGGGYFLAEKSIEKRMSAVEKKTAAEKEQRTADKGSDQQAVVADVGPVDPSSDTIKKGYVIWQDPSDLGDLGLARKELYSGCIQDECGNGDSFSSNGIKYLQVGQVAKGKYEGHDVIVVASSVYEGPSVAPDMFRMLRKNGDYIFLANEKYGLDEYMLEFVKTVFSKGSGKKTFESRIVVEELDYPEELYGLSERQRFIKDPYARAFFTDAKLKKAFVNQKFGQVWMTDSEKALQENATAFELNSYWDAYNKQKSYYDIFGRHGFYMKAADGTAVSYKMKMDIYGNNDDRFAVLLATWNDGNRNKSEFERNPSSCGSGDYVYDETLTVNIENDLVPVGKTDQGDEIYGYRTTNHPGFQKLYHETYYVPEGEKKKSLEEFLKIRPKVFWKDYFGRTLAFYNSEIISPAECGKPVIYLYPEKETDVSVKVEPGKGLSYTDPAYGNGWNVRANADGRLVNLTDGKTYPYLFWEGASDVYYETPKTGFSVADSQLDVFFDDILSELGLAGKEISDFKEFWIPKMRESGKPYYFITFLSKNYIDALAPLTIEPKPDTVIRVMMDYEPIEAPVNYPEFKIDTPERKGFTAVEWGGMLKSK